MAPGAARERPSALRGPAGVVTWRFEAKSHRRDLEDLDAAADLQVGALLGHGDGGLEVRRPDDRVPGRPARGLAADVLSLAERGAAIDQVLAERAEPGHPGVHDLLALGFAGGHVHVATREQVRVLTRALR